MKSILFSEMFIRHTVYRDGVPVSEAKDLRPETAQIQALLRDGQYGRDDFFHNAGWYNKEGVRIGYGDIRTDQFKALPEVLPQNEIFFILSERDSSIDLPMGRSQEEPGISYVLAKALALATPLGVYVISRNPEANATPQPSDIGAHHGCSIEGFVVNREWARRLVEAAT